MDYRERAFRDWERFPFCPPEETEILNNLYSAMRGLNKASLENLLSGIRGFVEIWRPSGLDWFWVAEFEGQVQICFPWFKPRSIDNPEIKLARSIILCGPSEVNSQRRLLILLDVMDKFWDMFFSKNHHDPGRELPSGIFFRRRGGVRVVPEWYAKVRAYLNPVEGDMVHSHFAAKKWFEEQGFVIV